MISPARIGVIGLGAIGGGIASCLARAGTLVATYDRRADAADGLDGVPASSATPAALAGQCDAVIVAVVDAAQTRDVLFGPDGVLAGGPVDIILVATISLREFHEIRADVRAAGSEVVDCGVVGGKEAGLNGLICLVGAEAPVLDRLAPVFAGFARYVVPMGEPGSGMTAKLIYNAVLHGCLRAGREGEMLAKASGIDIAKLVSVFSDSAASVGGPLLMVGRQSDPAADPVEAATRRNMATFIRKDLAAARELADAADLSLPLLELSSDTVDEIVGVQPLIADQDAA